MSVFTQLRTTVAAALVFAALEVGGIAGAALPAPPLTIGTVTIADGTAVVNGSVADADATLHINGTPVAVSSSGGSRSTYSRGRTGKAFSTICSTPESRSTFRRTGSTSSTARCPRSKAGCRTAASWRPSTSTA
jgi:hypothetical protein